LSKGVSVEGRARNGDHMLLISGEYDVPEELWEAYQMGVCSGQGGD